MRTTTKHVRDQDGDVWTQRPDGRWAWEHQVTDWDTLERKYGPLKPVSWVQATWQARLMVVTGVIVMLGFIACLVFALVSDDWLIFPNVFLPPVAIILIIWGVIRTITWIWPDLKP